MEVQISTRKGAILRAKEGRPSPGHAWICSAVDILKRDSAGGSTGTVWMPIRVYWMGVYVGLTWRIRFNRPYAAAVRPYVKLL